MKREDLIKSEEYIISQIQLELLNLIAGYKEKKNLKDYELAEELGVSKGYVSQILHATFDHKISKIVELAMACDHVPFIHFVDKETYLKMDREGKTFEMVAKLRPKVLHLDNSSRSTKIQKSANTSRKASR